MSKTKNKEALDQLYNLVIKEAAEAKPNNIASEPGKDTNYQSVSESTETTDQNSVGADKLKPQEYSQKPATDPSKPVAKAAGEEPAVEPETGKEAAAPVEAPAEEASTNEVAKMASELLKAIEKMSAEAKPNNISGVPGKDTNFQSVSDKTEKTDQNAVGADKLKPQEYSQKPSSDASKPVAKAAGEVTEEDVNKVASYELGRQLAEAIFKQAQVNQLEQIKTAGRRDFELLVAQAAQELEQAQPVTQKTASVQDMDKVAEEQGAEAFQVIYKQAQYEYAITELVKHNQALNQKIASLENEKVAAEKKFKEAVDAKEAFIAKKAAEEQEAQKYAMLTEHITNTLMDRMKSELLKSNA